MPRSAYLPLAANGPDIGTGHASWIDEPCANAARDDMLPSAPGTADSAASFNSSRRFKLTLLIKGTRDATDCQTVPTPCRMRAAG